MRVDRVGSDDLQGHFEAVDRLDTVVEIDYWRNGGILQTVLRKLLRRP